MGLSVAGLGRAFFFLGTVAYGSQRLRQRGQVDRFAPLVVRPPNPDTGGTGRQTLSRDSNRKIRALEEARCLPGVGLLLEAVWSGSEPSNTGAQPSAPGSN